MITGSQIRSARAALNWSAAELARKCRVSLRTIQRLELIDGVPESRSSTLLGVQSVFEAAGIEFIGSPTDRPGVRLVVERSGSQGRKRRQGT
jgi:transcriptional regulator with XRE-family HTH domain